MYNHVTEVLIYFAKTYGDGPFRKIRVYLISRFFPIHENRENFMLAKYTWFTVLNAGQTSSSPEVPPVARLPFDTVMLVNFTSRHVAVVTNRLEIVTLT